MDLTEGSETSAIINQTPGNYPKESLLQKICSLPSSKYDAYYTPYGPRSHTKHEHFYQQDFLHKPVNNEGTVKEFQGTCTIQDAIFNVACAWDSVKAPSLEGSVARCNAC